MPVILNDRIGRIRDPFSIIPVMTGYSDMGKFISREEFKQHRRKIRKVIK